MNIENLFRLVAVSPNRDHCEQVFRQYKDIPLKDIEISPTLIENFRLAQKKIKILKMPANPLMEKVEQLVLGSLQLDKSIVYNLNRLLHGNFLQYSQFDSWLKLVDMSNTSPILLSDLEILFGSDWFNIHQNGKDSFVIEPLKTLKTLYTYIYAKQKLKIAPHQPKWKSFAKECLHIAKRLTQENYDKGLYIPVGYADSHMNCLHLLAIQKSDNKCTLRLLTADFQQILARGSDHFHRCPEVIWENVSPALLQSEEFWKPLREAATLSEEEKQEQCRNSQGDFLSFDSHHLIAWITRKVGRSPISWNLDFEEKDWKPIPKNYFSSPQCVESNIERFGTRPSDQNGSVILKGTRLMMKAPIGSTHRKFAHLIAQDMLEDIQEYRLFKAESNLLIFIGAILSLQQGNIPPSHRGNFMRILELGACRITAPLEKMFKEHPSREQIEHAKILMSTLAEAQHRYALFKKHTDHIQLAAPHSFYPSIHRTVKIDAKSNRFGSSSLSGLDAILIMDSTQIIPYTPIWNVEAVGKLHTALEEWYQILLDAQSKCEPAEIITMAHRHIFSKLPIPETDTVEDLFPEPLSEGLLVGTLIMLKKICSLVTAAAYEEEILPALWITDLARAYRFGIELLRRFNPKIKSIPVSWHPLYQFMNSRHSYHAPGECRQALDKLVKSFQLISPNGHLRTSETYKEIPLFYHSWESFPIRNYVLHKEKIMSKHGGLVNLFSVDEVLSLANLSDAIGLKNEETGGDVRKWMASFAGQAFLAMQEISQYQALSVFATTKIMKDSFKSPDYFENHVIQHLGPEDHFKIGPSFSGGLSTEYENRFGGDKLSNKKVYEAKTSMPLRMVKLQDKTLRTTLKKLPLTLTTESRTQAELIKKLPTRGAAQRAYFLNQIASGHSSLSPDVLLEYFETRSSLLLIRDNRAFFSGIINSAHIFSEQCEREMTLLHRLSHFFQDLIEEDSSLLIQSKLHLERLLWVSERLREAFRIAPEEIIRKQLYQVGKILLQDDKNFQYSAPHLLCINHLLNGSLLTPIDLARFHLIVGQFPPLEPNDYGTWLETCHAMQERAHEINTALKEGNVHLWELILGNKTDALQVLKMQPATLSLGALSKTNRQLKKLYLQIEYLENVIESFKKYSWRSEGWKDSAIKKVHAQAIEQIEFYRKEAITQSKEFIERTISTLCFSPTAVYFQLNNKSIYINWEFGRLIGLGKVAKRLPVYIRKQLYLKAFGPLLQQEIVHSTFKNAPNLSMDVSKGEFYYAHESNKYQLVDQNLPNALKEGFTLWIDPSTSNGLIMVHREDGTPMPVFSLGEDQEIHPLNLETAVQDDKVMHDSESLLMGLKADNHLSLADNSFYHEAQIFSRWGFSQESLLIWLDQEGQVAEIYAPIKYENQNYLRFIREGSRWKINGTDLFLISKDEAIPAFAGHPIYLLAEDSQKRSFLLLTKVPENHQEWKKIPPVTWNQVMTSGAQEEMHLYRILPTGQIEGLTVADNLLLLLWKHAMGHYEAAAELSKRWIAPSGRAYNKSEQALLLPWLDETFRYNAHPSARAVFTFVIARMVRHLHEFPPTDGILWKELFGEDVFPMHYCIYKTLLGRELDGKGISRVQFDRLVSTYDHESVLRFLHIHGKLDEYFALRLDKRLGFAPPLQKDTVLNLGISGSKILGFGDSNRDFDESCKQYPCIAQTKIIPIERINRNLVYVECSHFFDYAYTLLKNGAQTEAEVRDLQALIQGIKDLRGPKAKDRCLRYYSIHSDYLSEHPALMERQFIFWLLLEEVHSFLEKGGSPHDLPAPPSIDRRFGLALGDSEEQAKKFFFSLGSLNGKDPYSLAPDFLKSWFEQLKVQYMDQRYPYLKASTDLEKNIESKVSPQLLKDIEEWKSLVHEYKPPNRLEINLHHWTHANPSILETEMEKFAIREIEKKQALLAEANRLPSHDEDALEEMAKQLFYVSPRTIDECIGLALRSEESAWLSACPHSNPGLLQRLTLEYLDVAVELQHLRRVIACQEEYTRRTYPPTNESLVLMVTEYYADTRLRISPDQAGLILALSKTNDPMFVGTVVQAIPGAGKSLFIGPCQMQKMLGYGKIPILSVPQALFQTTLSYLQSIMWNRFRTHVRSFEFDRENCDINMLYMIAEKLKIAHEEPTIFVCRPRDLHALQLMLKERHQIAEDMRNRLRYFVLEWAKSVDVNIEYEIRNEEWEEAKSAVPDHLANSFQRWYDSHLKLEMELQAFSQEADILQAILRLIQTKGSILIDEAANVMDPKNQLSFPIGWQEPANPQAALLAGKLYFEWLPQFEKVVHLNDNLQSYTTSSERKKLYEEIALKAYQEYKSQKIDLPPFNYFKAYLFTDPKLGSRMKAEVDAWSRSESLLTRQLAQEIAFLKYCLTTGLEGALSSTAFVNYGRSIQDGALHLVIPYERANVPKENTLYRKPWKTVLMTCQYYSQTWRDRKQTIELIDYILGLDPKGKDSTIIHAAQEIWGRRHLDEDVSNELAMQQLTEELDKARLIPEKAPYARILIRTYLEHLVFPIQLKLDPAQLTSTPQDLPMIASKTDAMGGTFGYESTWNLKLARKPDESIKEKVLKALKETRNQTCNHLPVGGSEALFQMDLSKFMALKDVGAICKGFSNEAIAKRLLEKLSSIDAVLFFDQKARLSVMTRNSITILEQTDHQGVERSLQKLNVRKAFVYYDQASCVGMDIKLPAGTSLVTFSDKVTLDDLIQGVMRSRQLLEGSQSVEYAIPHQMGENWDGDRVVEQAKLQQIEQEEKSNFHGICDQLRGHVRAIIDRNMRLSKDHETRHSIYKKASEFLLEKQENDLVKAFGDLPKLVPTKKALKKLVDDLSDFVFRVLSNEYYDCSKTLKEILKMHETKGTRLPEYIREGEESEEATQEVDVSKDLDRMLQMEEEYEKMLGSRIPKEETPWTVFNPKWIKSYPIGSTSKHKEMPTLYTLQEAVAERGHRTPFSQNLLVSQNLLETFMGQPNCLLTSNQKPVHRCLLITGSNPKLVLLSEGDAAYLKEHLNKMENSEGKGMYLIEPSGKVNQRGVQSKEITVNLWKEGSQELRLLLFQALVFQGGALAMEQIPENELKEVWKKWGVGDTRALQVLFESALEFRSDDLISYRKNRFLKSLFH